jgi:hypothetical protein
MSNLFWRGEQSRNTPPLIRTLAGRPTGSDASTFRNKTGGRPCGYVRRAIGRGVARLEMGAGGSAGLHLLGTFPAVMNLSPWLLGLVHA